MLALVLVALCLLSGCSLILPSADELAGDETGAGGSSSCPGSRGPAMVDVGEYCIDSSEVTAQQYAEFLDAAISPGENPDVGCASNDPSYQPATWPNDAIDDRPVVFVDFCDAVGFCDFAGKRLCGGKNGALIESSNYPTPDPSIDEWYGACTNGGTSAYPYGDTQVPDACNRLADHELSSVKALAGCHGQGAYEDVFDLGGNASEWVNVCNGGFCRSNGGAVGVSSDECETGDAGIVNESATAFNRGFRCCADRLP